MSDSPSRWNALARAAIVEVLAAVAGGLFPRQTRWVRWPHGLSPRGRLGYADATGLLTFAMKELAHALRQQRNEVVAALREELGREPTDEEIQRQWRRDYARESLEETLGREPTEREVHDFLESR